jgi:uncharacterized protein YgbK (DUF1537 family)
MYALLVLADDLTGALDTGIQAVKKGIPTLVCPRWRGAFSGGSGGGALVINSGSRHCSPAEARRIVAEILEQFPAVPYVYKKTDSTLRGHIGAELEALVRGRNLGVLPFVPAYPGLGRSTRRGRQYLGGLPIDETAAAADALNPVRHSFIPDIIAEESRLPVRLIPVGPGPAVSGTPGADWGPEIWVFDAESDADLRNIARTLGERKLLAAAAGCAGFAEFLMDYGPGAGECGAGGSVVMGSGAGEGGAEKCGADECGAEGGAVDAPVLIVSGSRHPASLAQVRAAVEAGVPALALEGEKLLRPGWPEGEEAAALVSRCGELLRRDGRCILGTRLSLGLEGEGAPQPGGAAEALGKLTARVLKQSGPLCLAVFGGDTLLGITEALDCRLLRPLREIQPGIVLATAECPGGGFLVAAKSGAFGGPGLIAELGGFFRQSL